MRLKRYAVTPQLMAAMFKTSEEGAWWRVSEGVPRTAEFLHCYVDESGRYWWLVFSDDSFPEVLEGDILPVGEITLKSETPIVAY